MWIDRIVSGPIPALRNMSYESKPGGGHTITGGDPTWPEGADIEQCQAELDDSSLTSFLREMQHNTSPPGRGMFEDAVRDTRRLSAEIPLRMASPFNLRQANFEAFGYTSGCRLVITSSAMLPIALQSHSHRVGSDSERVGGDLRRPETECGCNSTHGSYIRGGH